MKALLGAAVLLVALIVSALIYGPRVERAEKLQRGGGEAANGTVAPTEERQAMDQRVSIVTLGVADVARSTAFYEGLGWTKAGASQDAITFFNLNGLVLALYERGALAEDADIPAEAVPAPGSFSGVTLAYNTYTEDEVDRLVAAAEEAGARIVKPPRQAFWGGYSGYIADPDGHLWEIAYNPYTPPLPDGSYRMARPESGDGDREKAE